MTTLNTEKLYDLGRMISETIIKEGAQEANLTIYVDKNSLHKIDEDLFYRLNNKEDKKEFVPSGDEIHLTFRNTNIMIKARET